MDIEKRGESISMILPIIFLQIAGALGLDDDLGNKSYNNIIHCRCSCSCSNTRKKIFRNEEKTMTRLGGFGFLDDFHCEKTSFLTFGAFVAVVVLCVYVVSTRRQSYYRCFWFV